MTSSSHRRGRWWRGIVAAVVLLAVVPIAWHFRPLNAMEKRLVGTWDIRDDRWDGFITFTEERRFTFLFRSRSPETGWDIPDIAGSWRASGSRLRYTYDSPTRNLWSFLWREWALHSTGMSRTASIPLTPVKSAPGEDAISYRSTDPSVPMTLSPLSAADRARLGPGAPSPKPEPDRP